VQVGHPIPLEAAISVTAAAVMDRPAARLLIRACADAGKQARLLPEVPIKMKLADKHAALLPLTPTGTAGVLVGVQRRRGWPCGRARRRG